MIVSGYWPSQAPYERIPLPELLRRSAEGFGDKPALIGADGTTHTYREVWSCARKVARFLQDHGIEKGDKVGILLNDREPSPVGLLQSESARRQRI
jgi:acyl-CoA synthetase (AMP-forming)/AMP-acid ligase II